MKKIKLKCITLLLLAIVIQTHSASGQQRLVSCAIYDFYDQNNLPNDLNPGDIFTAGILNTTYTLELPRAQEPGYGSNHFVKESQRFTRKVFNGLQPYFKEAALVDVIVVQSNRCNQSDYGRRIINEDGQVVIRYYAVLGQLFDAREEEKLLTNISTALANYRNTIIGAEKSFEIYSEDVEAAFASITDRILLSTMSESDKSTIRDAISELIAQEMEELINQEVERRIALKNEN